jgi:hypothetical protein
MGFTVYALHDGDDVPRYVGATNAPPRTRLNWHLNSARTSARWSPPVARWIRSVLAAGGRVQIVRIASTESLSMATAIETAQIARYRASGQLLNVRNAGYVPGVAHRMAIAAAIRARGAPSFITRVRISRARTAARIRRAATI